ncbi:MAG: PRD domain-containing protein [Peptoniphilaceae bacterium]|nr:PRD domain-containing protein [Peptoniphilaceae bacterium]MDY6018968.1 PRD domain-containing protein [Anaerococcus sp.]
MSERLKVIKILNNNIVLCKDEKGDKLIVENKGLGFFSKNKLYINKSKDFNVYMLQGRENLNAYVDLIPKCDPKLIEITGHIIEKIKTELSGNVDEYIYIALLDHLNFSIYRYKKGIKFETGFFDEFSMIYGKIYDFSIRSLEYINKSLDINLPKEEAGFITLHIDSAINRNSMQKTQFIAEFITRSLKTIEKDLGRKIPNNSIEKQRLIIHLKFAVKRAENNETAINPLEDEIIRKYKRSYKIAKEISKIAREYNINLLEGEVSYLAIHIQSIMMEE